MSNRSSLRVHTTRFSITLEGRSKSWRDDRRPLRALSDPAVELIKSYYSSMMSIKIAITHANKVVTEDNYYLWMVLEVSL